MRIQVDLGEISQYCKRLFLIPNLSNEKTHVYAVFCSSMIPQSNGQGNSQYDHSRLSAGVAGGGLSALFKGQI